MNMKGLVDRNDIHNNDKKDKKLMWMRLDNK